MRKKIYKEKEPNYTYTIKSGTIVNISGIPVEIIDDSRCQTSTDLLKINNDLRNHYISENKLAQKFIENS